MVCALALGREGSKGFPGKNLFLVMGRPLMAYPLMAARAAKSVDCLYLSTDSEKMKQIGRASGRGSSIVQRSWPPTRPSGKRPTRTGTGQSRKR